MKSYWHAALATRVFIPVRERLVDVQSSGLARALRKGVLVPQPLPVAASGMSSIRRVHAFLLVTFQPLSESALRLLQSHSLGGGTGFSRKRPDVALPRFTSFSVANFGGEGTVIMWGFCSPLNPTQSCVAEHFSPSRKTL